MKDKKKPRTDKRRNVGKVAEALAENPNKTVREVAKETNMSTGAVHNSMVELEQSGTKDATIAYIVNSAKDRIKNISKVLDHKTKKILDKVDADEEIDNKDIYLLKDIAKDDLSRVTVLGGNVTDDNGGLQKDKERWDNASVEELLQFLKTK